MNHHNTWGYPPRKRPPAKRIVWALLVLLLIALLTFAWTSAPAALERFALAVHPECTTERC